MWKEHCAVYGLVFLSLVFGQWVTRIKYDPGRLSTPFPLVSFYEAPALRSVTLRPLAPAPCLSWPTGMTPLSSTPKMVRSHSLLGAVYLCCLAFQSLSSSLCMSWVASTCELRSHVRCSDSSSSVIQLGVHIKPRLRVLRHDGKAQVYLDIPGVFIQIIGWEDLLNTFSFIWDVVGALCLQSRPNF